ncbi:MAG: hypothetical protein U1F77_10340, partial [Kiritimatiellia bacterium]
GESLWEDRAAGIRPFSAASGSRPPLLAPSLEFGRSRRLRGAGAVHAAVSRSPAPGAVALRASDQAGISVTTRGVFPGLVERTREGR